MLANRNLPLQEGGVVVVLIAFVLTNQNCSTNTAVFSIKFYSLVFNISFHLIRDNVEE